MIVLQSASLWNYQLMKARSPRDLFLEARMEKGRGAVATVLCHEGTVKIGDYFIAGQSHMEK